MAKSSGPTLYCIINKCNQEMQHEQVRTNQEMQHGQVKTNQLVLTALPS